VKSTYIKAGQLGKTLSRGGDNVGQQGRIAQAKWDNEWKSINDFPKIPGNLSKSTCG